MRIDVVTLFPDLFTVITESGVTGRAHAQKLWMLSTWNPRDFTEDVHRTVDDRPYGGGPGMVMKVEPLRDAIQAARMDSLLPAKTVFLSPQGRLLNQQAVIGFASLPRLILVAGRYEGVDERLVEAEIDEEWSIGDYVLSGGELAALVLFDAVVRLIPGVLGHAESAEQDSHMTGLLDCPHYTRPERVDGREVPQILQSGNHDASRRWRLQQSLQRTRQRRPDLMEGMTLDSKQQTLLDELVNDILVDEAKN